MVRPRFDRELSAVVAEQFPGGLVTDEAMFSMVLDHFALQYRLFTRLLKPKQGFHWETDGEQLLRKHKPSYFDGTLLPRTVVLPEPLSSALRRARAESH